MSGANGKGSAAASPGRQPAAPSGSSPLRATLLLAVPQRLFVQLRVPERAGPGARRVVVRALLVAARRRFAGAPIAGRIVARRSILLTVHSAAATHLSPPITADEVSDLRRGVMYTWDLGAKPGNPPTRCPEPIGYRRAHSLSEWYTTSPAKRGSSAFRNGRG
jgi:hypothetical protein